jgi:segregation and condensation protein A
VSIFDLLNAVNGVLQRFKKREGDARDIFEDKWTVSEKIEFILKIIAERGSVRFAELFESAANRSEVICTFLALLELIRLKQLACAQPEPFAEIEIRRAEIASPTAEVPVSEPAQIETAPQPVASQTAETNPAPESTRQS